MPFCKFCVYADVYKRDKYNCVLCKCEGKYYYEASQLNHCNDYKPTSRASYNDEHELKKADQKFGIDTNDSSCFITTTVCDILNLKDDCLVLQILRHLRDQYMIKEEKYNTMLLEYYIIGPSISKKMLELPNSKEVAKDNYNKYLIPASLLVVEGKYEEAINLYQTMVTTLKKQYHISTPHIQLDSNIKLKTKEDFKKISKILAK